MDFINRTKAWRLFLILALGGGLWLGADSNSLAQAQERLAPPPPELPNPSEFWTTDRLLKEGRPANFFSVAENSNLRYNDNFGLFSKRFHRICRQVLDALNEPMPLSDLKPENWSGLEDEHERIKALLLKNKYSVRTPQNTPRLRGIFEDRRSVFAGSRYYRLEPFDYNNDGVDEHILFRRSISDLQIPTITETIQIFDNSSLIKFLNAPRIKNRIFIETAEIGLGVDDEKLIGKHKEETQALYKYIRSIYYSIQFDRTGYLLFEPIIINDYRNGRNKRNLLLLFTDGQNTYLSLLRMLNRERFFASCRFQARLRLDKS